MSGGRAGGDQTVMRDRDETRAEIARTLRTHIAAQPMTLAVDDLKMAALAELVLRIAHGHA
ncbi:hypothetical protein [Williamsia muralis]|uniref:Uncharacterized protein n=1 Tax=Williamsia marianensis TaxID=85044 RepID=A0ABU4F0U6_WILMA|nr:hypothetical protein [Williamsia muralis]MDV7137113.1 hypothetical protein [Williamsia muralis]